MTDWLNFPGQAGVMPRAAAPRAVAVWLWSVAALVFLMVIVGGATRLTESGLSITEWKPVTGILPPLSHEAWLAEFEKYKRIPQYAQLFPNMDLAHFQYIFFWEWGHRVLGRVIGIAFAVPLLVFWLRGMLPDGMWPKLVGLLALGGLQGFVGWWMVSSGLVNRVEVAQERLAIHLLLASVTFAALVWLAASLSAKPAEVIGAGVTRLRVAAVLLLVLILVQIGLGGLVAGLRAGYTYNTWPLMDEHFVPPMEHLFKLSPWWINFFDNITTVQFQHRMTAYALLAFSLWHAFDAARVVGRTGSGSVVRGLALVLSGAVVVQALAGIVTLLLVVPLWAGLLHQALAMVVLAIASIHAQRLWR